MSDSSAPAVDVKQIVSAVAPIIASIAVGMMVEAVMKAAVAASVTNYKKSSVAGDNEMHPSQKETKLIESSTAGTKTDSNMLSDEVNAQNGSVEASEVEATASTAESTASEAGASASRVKAGASDVETKALKVM